MKKYLWLPLLLMAVISSAALTTKAQSTYGIRANVPFEFTVGNTTIAAGKIAAREMSTNSGALVISNLDKAQHAIRIAHSVSSSKDSNEGKLVFHRYGNRYYLAQVWIPGYNGLQLSKSKSERALKGDTLLSKNSTPEVVTIKADLL
jgi:hypothetical protein